MVDKPQINPQGYSRGRQDLASATGIGTLSLRGVSSVSDTAYRSQRDAFLSLADDGELLQRTSQQMFDTVRADIENRQIIESESLYSTALLNIQQEVNKVRQEADFDADIPKLSLDAYEGIINGILEADDLSGFQKEYLKRKFDAQATTVLNSALEYQSQLNKIRSEQKLNQYIQTQSVLAFNNPDLIHDIVADLGETVNNLEGIDPKLMEMNKSKAVSAFANSAIRGRIAQDPQMASDDLEAGIYDDYIDGATKDQLMQLSQRRIETPKLSVDQLNQRAEIEVNLQTDPFSVTDAQLEAAREEGIITDTQFVSYKVRRDTSKVDYDIKIDQKKIVHQALSDDRFNLRPNDSEHKKAVDEYYLANIIPQVESLDPALRNQTIAQFVSKANIVPKSLVGDIQGKIRGGDPEQKKDAVDIISKIRMQNPVLDIGLSAKDQAFIDDVSAILRYNSDPQAAINLAEQNMNMAPQLRKARENNFNDEFKYKDVEKVFTDKFDEGLFLNEPDVLIEDQQRSMLIDDIQSAAKQYYLQRGSSMDDAVTFAIQKVSPQWGKTTADGKNKIMKYPPEAFYPPDTSGSYEYLQKQLEKAVTDLAPDVQDYFLVADNVTASMATTVGTANEVMPAYMVIVQTEEGFGALMRDGVAVRMQFAAPDYEAERKEKIKQAKIKKAKISRMGTVQARWDEVVN